MRPVDLARRHDLSTQTVRNYEDAGIIPPAGRGPTGYRNYTAAHAAGLAAYLALVPAFGSSTSRRIMHAATAGRLDEALEYVDDGHALLARDRATLRTVESALSHLGAVGTRATADDAREPFSIGEVARHLALAPATLRTWERTGVLAPRRDPRTGHRRYVAQDVRDAELAHLLRRGGRSLGTIATVLRELRDVGSLDALARTLEPWRRDLTSRGLAMLSAAGQLSAYLDALGRSGTTGSARPRSGSGQRTGLSVRPDRMRRMSPSTAADYGWIRSSSSLFTYALEFGYTLTLVRGVPPTEVLRRAGAVPRDAVSGLAALIEEHTEVLFGHETWPESFVAGAFTVPGECGDWTLALEFGGDLGTRPAIMEALSAGTRAVSHSRNGGKPMHFFHWYEDGELRTTFESAAYRSGSTPDELTAVMREVGLNPTGDQDPGVDGKAAVFALTERLTGVRVTEDLLAEAVYQTGEVPEEPAEEWKGVIIDITDAHGDRTYAATSAQCDATSGAATASDPGGSGRESAPPPHRGTTP
ncbi:DUF6461 domain-containing protein [Streptomyces sp. NBC_01104]|uniref:DUF6461 domain-containing protein n=1 Tax=Streptomyces sp. NBC_01104 TaxID=2903750 RepID=UPI00386A5E6D